MTVDIKTLELERDKIRQKLEALDDFRFGSITESFRRCGKKRCVCASKDHPGHGPQYLLTVKQDGKTVTQSLRLGPELDLARTQIENGRRFDEWYRAFVKINEQICRLRPIPKIEDEQELEDLKKKLRARFTRKLRKR